MHIRSPDDAFMDQAAVLVVTQMRQHAQTGLITLLGPVDFLSPKPLYSTSPLANQGYALAETELRTAIQTP